MGLVYLPTWMVDYYGKLVGTYTVRPMDPMGMAQKLENTKKKYSHIQVISRLISPFIGVITPFITSRGPSCIFVWITLCYWKKKLQKNRKNHNSASERRNVRGFCHKKKVHPWKWTAGTQKSPNWNVENHLPPNLHDFGLFSRWMFQVFFLMIWDCQLMVNWWFGLVVWDSRGTPKQQSLS